MTVAEITRKTRQEQRLTLAQFGRDLAPIVGRSLTRQAVSHWETGRQQPDEWLLIACALRCSDWRRDWAQACLSEMKPEVFGPAVNVSIPTAITQQETDR